MKLCKYIRYVIFTINDVYKTSYEKSLQKNKAYINRKLQTIKIKKTNGIFNKKCCPNSIPYFNNSFIIWITDTNRDNLIMLNRKKETIA